MTLSDAELDRILAGRNQLGVTEKEEILARVLQTTSPPRRTRPFVLPAWAWGATAVVLLAPALFFLAHRPISEFAARGGEAVPSFVVSCLSPEGRGSACAPGGKMVFQIDPGPFRAFAAIAEAPDGTTLWYFPGGDRAFGIDLTGLKPNGLLEEAISIGSAGPAGEYVIHGLFSERPLSKNEVRDAIREPEGHHAVVVVRRLRVGSR
jgi:hypothetical protein